MAGFEVLIDKDGFYEHMNWHRVSDAVKAKINAIGERIGERLCGLDEKLAALLDNSIDRQIDD